MSDLQVVVGRILSDENFAQRLVESPEVTLREVGVDPTPELLEALQGLDLQALQQLTAAFGEDKAA